MAAVIMSTEKMARINQVIDEGSAHTRELCSAHKTTPAVGRNFELVVKKTKRGVNIVLKHEDGRETVLSRFLPRKHSFVGTDKFRLNRKRRKIEFIEDSLPNRGSLLILFHEIGHSHHKPKDHFTLIERIKASWEKWKILKTYQIPVALQKEEEQEGSGIEYLKKLIKLPFDAFYPFWARNKVERLQAEDERNAWAYSLRALRKLEKKGFEVFSEFDNVADICTQAEAALETYDFGSLGKKIIFVDRDALEEMIEFAPFSHWKSRWCRDAAKSLLEILDE